MDEKWGTHFAFIHTAYRLVRQVASHDSAGIRKTCRIVPIKQVIIQEPAYSICGSGAFWSIAGFWTHADI